MLFLVLEFYTHNSIYRFTDLLVPQDVAHMLETTNWGIPGTTSEKRKDRTHNNSGNNNKIFTFPSLFINLSIFK